MSSTLTTEWSEHDEALCRLLPRLTSSLEIFDRDLQRLRLERPENVELLRVFLAAGEQRRIQIVVQDPAPLRDASPRLFKLLTLYPQRLEVRVGGAALQSLTDSLLIVDQRHALIRFHIDHARAKLIIDDERECAPYRQRFAEILRESTETVSATTLGL